MALFPAAEQPDSPDGAQESVLFRRERFVLRGFSRTTDVLEAARLCREAGVACRLVPRPASLGNAECGTALRTLPADEARVRGLLAGAGIEPDGVVETVDYA